MKTLFFLFIVMFLSSCDFIRDLKYNYYKDVRGVIKCHRIEQIKEEGEYATKIIHDKDPVAYVLRNLDQEMVSFHKEDDRTFDLKKESESEETIWFSHKSDTGKVQWIWKKNDATLTEIIIEENPNVNVVVNKFSCR